MTRSAGHQQDRQEQEHQRNDIPDDIFGIRPRKQRAQQRNPEQVIERRRPDHIMQTRFGSTSMTPVPTISGRMTPLARTSPAADRDFTASSTVPAPALRTGHRQRAPRSTQPSGSIRRTSGERIDPNSIPRPPNAPECHRMAWGQWQESARPHQVARHASGVLSQGHVARMSENNDRKIYGILG